MNDPIYPVPNDPTSEPARPAAFQNSNSRGADIDRRRRRRAMISVPVRVRRRGYGAVDEVSTTVDVSRLGFLFITTSTDYSRGMEVRVLFPYNEAPDSLQAEQQARVVRVAELSGNRRAVAIAVGQPEPRERAACPAPVPNETARGASRPLAECSFAEAKPLVLVLDSETTVLESVKTLLTAEGYEVIAVNNGRDASEVLKLFTPAIVVAEIEGEAFPGYALCAHVKETPRLQRVPVVLVTKGGNPSDYRGAHSLGAVVCMTKPFKNERLLQVARLLAPLQHPRS